MSGESRLLLLMTTRQRYSTATVRVLIYLAKRGDLRGHYGVVEIRSCLDHP